MIRLALLIAAVAVSLGIATAATAEGLTPSTLINAGWTCFNDPGEILGRVEWTSTIPEIGPPER